MRELTRYPSALLGLVIIAGLISLAVYAVISLPYNEAIRKKENYIAKLKELEFKKLEGELVNADLVYTTLLDFATIKRNNLLAIPDRITDDLMALTDRNEFYKLLYDSIANELEKLSELKALNFTHD